MTLGLSRSHANAANVAFQLLAPCHYHSAYPVSTIKGYDLAAGNGRGRRLHGRKNTLGRMGQVRMWLIPQKSENDHEFDINTASFAPLLSNSLQSLLAHIDCSGSADYSLTDKCYKRADAPGFVEE